MIRIDLIKVEIPPKGVHLLVEGKLDEKPLRLVIDTGASRSVLDYNYLQENHRELELMGGDSYSTGVGSSGMQNYTVHLSKLKLGELLISDLEAVVMDLEHVIQSYIQIDQPPIYGIIGGDILDRYQVSIDYKKQQLILPD